MGLRETIFSFKPETKKIHVKAFGADVYIKGLSALEAINLEVEYNNKSKEDNLKDVKFLCKYIIAGVVDENGQQIFNDQDSDKLMSFDINTLNMLVEEIREFNLIDKTDTEKAKE